jgi:hypothetical protein
MLTTSIEYVHRGVVLGGRSRQAAGVTRVRHVFRFDLSPLFPRLHDVVKRVPIVDPDQGVRFVDAPRRYRVPVSVHLSYGGETYEDRAVVVLDKNGLRRLERVQPNANGGALDALELE